MKTVIIKILPVLIAILFFGCQPGIRFDEPQPKNKKNLKIIPRYYRGEYLRLSDSALLFITKDIIYREFKFGARILKAELKEEFDTIYEKDTELEFGPSIKMYIDIEDDSAFVSVHSIDTLFIINEDQILRRHKGYLFLNYKKAVNSWKVDILKLENGFLDFQELVSLSEIDSLKEITNINTVLDTSTNKVKRYELSPRKKELKNILERKEKGKLYKKL